MWAVAVVLGMIVSTFSVLVGVYVGYGLAERNHERGDWS